MSVILQNDIDKLASYIKTWQMQLNVTKCHTMRIYRKKEPVLMDYYIDLATGLKAKLPLINS